LDEEPESAVDKAKYSLDNDAADDYSSPQEILEALTNFYIQ
jgi:hypothetical protein